MYVWHDLVNHNGTGWPGKGQGLGKVVQAIISDTESPAVIRWAGKGYDAQQQRTPH